MVTLADAVSPVLSVTVTEYVPAISPVLAEEVLPFDQRYVYGAGPSDTTARAVPLAPPLQLTSVLLTVTVNAKAEGA